MSRNFIAFARYLPQTMLRSGVFAIFIITIAAAEAVGLAIVPALIATSRRSMWKLQST